MIIHEMKLVFVHIQKTGGDSISAALGQSTESPEKHFLARDLCRLYGDSIWSSYFKFGFVRNPWARLVSWWVMINGLRGAYDAGAKLNKFQTFVLQRAATFSEFLENCDEEIIDHDGPKWIFRNQTDYLTDSYGHQMVDFIGRFERLTEDFEVVLRSASLGQLTLPHVNRSVHAHYSDFYNPALVRLVERRYALDIETFKYRFES